MSHKLVPYEEYKDSGVESLGEIPEDWTTARLSFITTMITDGTHFSPESFTEGDFKYVTAKNIKETGFDFSELTFVPEAVHREIYSRSPVKKGDILYIKDGATAGVALVNDLEEEFSLLSSVAIIRPISTIDKNFLKYYLNSNRFKLPAIETLVGGAMTRFTLDLLNRFIVVTPPFIEQVKVVKYLDSETHRLELLIKEQAELIALLREKRQALVSRVVTKGLDPNAKKRPSGVEWIGDIPERWTCSKLGYIAEFTSGGTPSKERDDYWIGETPWVSPKDMKSRTLLDSEDHISRLAVEETGLKLVPANSLLIVVRGMILVHTFPVVRVGIEVTINQDVKAMQLADFMVTNFVHYYLEGVSQSVLDFFVDEAAHGTLAIRMERFSGLPVIVPPRNDQSGIADFLDIETHKIDELISEAESTITLMQEHRSALISAVVTGKVRVPA